MGKQNVTIQTNTWSKEPESHFIAEKLFRYEEYYNFGLVFVFIYCIVCIVFRFSCLCFAVELHPLRVF